MTIHSQLSKNNLTIKHFNISTSAMRIYDAHTHLNEESLFPNRKELLKAFVEA
jgi:hypothetical protein